MTQSSTISLRSQGFSDILDITSKVQQIVSESNIKHGICNIFVVGSTASISTIEFEPALVADMKDKLEQFAPHDQPTRHGDTWGDDNGFSHLRATFMGPSVSIPFSNGSLILGTWQQIVLIDHDNRPRNRELIVTVVGD